MANSTEQRSGIPAETAAMLKRAMIAHQNGRLDEAEPLYRAVLDSDPQQFDALQMLGILQCQRGIFEEARGLLARAVESNPRAAEAHCNLGRALWSLGRRQEALESVERAVALAPDLVIALNNRGVWLRALGRGQEALASYNRALVLAPNNLDIMFNRGSLLLDLRRPQEALADFDAALAHHAGYVDARIGRINALDQMQRTGEAMEELDRVLAADPGNVFALTSRGNILARMGRHEEALAAYNAAILAQPNYVPAYQSRGNLLMLRGVYRNAAADLATALRLGGHRNYVLGDFIYCRLQTCDWAGLDDARAALAEDVKAGKLAAAPLVMLAADPSPADQLACARAFVADRYPASAAAPDRRARAHDRIRLAYVSADPHAHPLAGIAAGAFEQHDRTRFETTAVLLSDGPDGPMRDRIKSAVDQCVTVAGNTDAEVVALMRELEVDIAVDLMGHAPAARTGIFAGRAAPVQVNYLGFPGTSGADYLDYIVADRFVIPEDQEQFYSEKVVCLPDAFMANDPCRAIAPNPWSRAEAGLPEQGVVFCAFNAVHKCSPRTFRTWMHLLRGAPGSVLWLNEWNDVARSTLVREAQGLGIEPGRLIFAPPLARPEDDLARTRLADIFLDTPDCNAHATAADALAAGVPIVTVAGRCFAGRVAGSLLRAVGMPELVTRSLPEYETLALELAVNADLLGRMKAKLARNRLTHPLFDTRRFTRHLEAAYVGMWEQYRRGGAPERFSVAAGQ